MDDDTGPDASAKRGREESDAGSDLDSGMEDIDGEEGPREAREAAGEGLRNRAL
eukprot:CAMPEP_0198330478 /NCGR_PEP_ID=MMETSP1450-20131203/16934_1 /TAXON_ID=753684 ORGANISM="Madagascaria erythrocladiodes, Strain CCMP3234" /NCGR_SAMPLE_ID=MMETSP1450 /ASSEMBLY_ACC=CAM_ASM_001115 /LENGTH=53 /DNA_ID=CAMNT_0044034773 /DNA_START=106 /DNA_END=264 /DNA_ORIENTATION=-